MVSGKCKTFENGINVAAQSWELQQIKCDNSLSIQTMDFYLIL